MSPAAPKVVNDWVDRATHHKISDLVDRFDDGTVAYLVNATYFHAFWATEFKSVPKPGTFHDFSNVSKTVAMMRRDNGVATVMTPDYNAVLLPYKGGRFSMVILLPRKVLLPGEFSGFLTPAIWRQVIEQLHSLVGPVFGGTKCQSAGCDGALVMPKFKLEYQAELLPLLVAMGMGTDLSQICNGCFLSRVVQKAYLEVDEKGTTAAAGTGGAGMVSLPPTTVVDHPFAMALIDNASDAPLFLGVIGNLQRGCSARIPHELIKPCPSNAGFRAFCA
jgi:serpin B